MKGLGGGFGRVWTAAGISNLGDGVMGAAFPLLVASLTRDPALVAGATLAQRLPWFLLALVSGALVDRLDRRRVMVVADLVRAGLVAVLALAVAGGWVGIPLIYLVAFALGVAETFFDTSAEALVPGVVAPDQLSAANGRLQAVEWLGNAFIGPPLGAALFALAATAPFGLNAVSFVAAGALIWAIPGQYRTERVAGSRLAGEVAEGLRWLLAQRVLRTLSLMAGGINLFATAIVAVFVLFAQDVLGVGAVGYGVLLTTLGVGGLAGAAVAPRAVARFGPGATIRGSVATGILVSALVGSTSSPWVAGVGVAGYGMVITGWNVVAVSLRQRLTPDRIRGRVAGAARLLAWGSQPLGAAMGGVIASAAGLRAPFFVAAAAWSLMLVASLGAVNNRTIAEAGAVTG